jgi:hypothetical protein
LDGTVAWLSDITAAEIFRELLITRSDAMGRSCPDAPARPLLSSPTALVRVADLRTLHATLYTLLGRDGLTNEPVLKTAPLVASMLDREQEDPTAETRRTRGSRGCRRRARKRTPGTARTTLDPGGGQMQAADNEWRRMLCEGVCDRYNKINDIRTKLLGLLPLATGASVLVGLKRLNLNSTDPNVKPFPGVVGAFGFFITLTLLAFEPYGIMEHHHYIETTKRIEQTLGDDGQLRNRPLTVLGFINEPVASGVLYLTSPAAWTFLGLCCLSPHGLGRS